MVALMGAGCVAPEQKMGRGISNLTEFTRLGEFERSAEQGGLFYGTDAGITTGVLMGFHHSLERTGMGLYEVVTAPFPPYRPILTDYVSAKPAYPDAYRPRKWSDAMFDTDRMSGFSGGDVAPWFPGSRFRVFDN